MKLWNSVFEIQEETLWGLQSSLTEKNLSFYAEIFKGKAIVNEWFCFEMQMF